MKTTVSKMKGALSAYGKAHEAYQTACDDLHKELSAGLGGMSALLGKATQSLYGLLGAMKKAQLAHAQTAADYHTATTKFRGTLSAALDAFGTTAGLAYDRSDPNAVDTSSRPANPNIARAGGYESKPWGERADGKDITVSATHPHNPATGEITPRVGDNDPANLFPSQEQNINSRKAAFNSLYKSLRDRGIASPEKLSLKAFTQLALTAKEQDLLVQATVAANAATSSPYDPTLHKNVKTAAINKLVYDQKGKERKLL